MAINFLNNGYFAGNVGIGTDSPGAKLHLSGITQTGSVNAFRIDNDTSNVKFQVKSVSGDYNLQFKNAGNTTKVFLNSNGNSYLNGGNVGIGTTSPTAPLHFGKTVYGAPSSEDFFRVKFFDNGGTMNDVGIGQPTAGAIGWNILPNSTGYYEWNSGTLGRIMNLDHLGKLTLDSYDSTNNTGTPTYLLGTDASGNIVKTLPQGSGTAGPYLPLAGGTMTGDLKLNDDVVAKFGTGNDLRIQHTGNQSYIQNYTGDLQIQNVATDKDILFRADDGNGVVTSYLVLDGSTTHAYFSNPGNVGIGTTSPSEKLQVNNGKLYITESANASTANLIYLENSGSGSNEGVSIKFNPMYGAESMIASNREGAASDDANLTFHTALADVTTEKMRITSDGNVGIGTDNPGSLLHVEGSRTTASLQVNQTGTGVIANFKQGANSKVLIDNAGNVGIGTTSPSSKLNISSVSYNDHITLTRSSDELGITVSGGQLMFEGGVSPFNNNDKDLGRSDKHWREAFVYSLRSGGALQFKTNGNNARMSIDTSGNVGIGTTSPSQIFEVSTTGYGVGKFTGNTDNGTGYVAAVVEIESNSNGRGRGVYLTHRDSTDTTDSEWYSGVPYTGTGYTIGNAAYGTSVNSDTGPAVLAQSRFFIKKDGNVGIGTTSPSSKLQVAGGVQMADDTDTASADKVGTQRYRVSGNNSYVDMCMQTGAATYAWINIVQNNW